jgi:hypothetical protein
VETDGTRQGKRSGKSRGPPNATAKLRQGGRWLRDRSGLTGGRQTYTWGSLRKGRSGAAGERPWTGCTCNGEIRNTRHEYDLHGLLRRRGDEVRDRIARADRSELDDRESWQKRSVWDPVELDEAKIRTRHEERGPQSLVSFVVPFRGDAALLRCRPSSYQSSHPSGDIEGSSLVFAYNLTGADADQLTRRFGSDLAAVKEWLTWSRADVEQHNQEMRQAVDGWISERLARLERNETVVKDLGYPEEN